VIAAGISATVFLVACAGLWFGLRLASWVPPEQLASEARSSAHIGIGMVATLAALVLGLMITSAKSSFDERRSEIVRVATSIVLLDHALAGYGEGALAGRRELRAMLDRTITRISSTGNLTAEEFGTPLSNLRRVTHLQSTILAMTPANDAQRWFQSRAIMLTSELAHERVLTVELGDHSMPTPVLVVVTLWVVLIFVGLGVFAVSNRAVIVALTFCALAFAGSIFLILELDTPYSGLIGISGAPLQEAAAEVGR
jgi:hypothetical protein